jgi:outer membrane immunogenic protein
MNNWSGLYVGAHVGYGWADFGFRNPTAIITAPGLPLPNNGVITVPLTRSYDGDSFLGGGQIGYNAQIGSVVFGIEADISGTDIDGQFRSSAGPFAVPGIGLVTTSEGVASHLEWLGTVRGRIGWAFDRWLVYGTGGVAFGGLEASGDITATNGVESLTLTASDRRTHIGWAAGVGVEGLITPNLSAKIEYLYADLGRETHEGAGRVTGTPGILALLPAGTSARAQGDFSVEVHAVKVGLNYRFNLFN